MITYHALRAFLCVCVLAVPAAADHVSMTRSICSGARVLFLGDSITAAGHYVDELETALRFECAGKQIHIVALGLGSETVSGLSEPDHPFPRPNLHDRLDQVLHRVQPEIVFACYGMNDAIYHPFSEDRFLAYQQGIRQLIKKVQDAGAQLVLLTPPPYAGRVVARPGPAEGESYGYKTPDPEYDTVLARYAAWIESLDGQDGIVTIDVRTPLMAHLESCYSGPDPIHPNMTGHRIMAEAIASGLDQDCGQVRSRGLLKHRDSKHWDEVRSLVASRRRSLDRFVLWDIGHNRPGKPPGGTLDDAQDEADRIDSEIARLVEAAANKVTVESVRRVYHNGEHNAFTDLVRFRDQLFLTFRSCPDGHMVHPTSSIIVLRSDDGTAWSEVHRFSVPKRDTRDPHFLIFNDSLFVYAGTWYCGESSPETYDLNQHLGYGVETEDGEHWSEPFLLEGTYGHYVWRAAAFDGTAFLCGRRKRDFAETATRAQRDPLVESAILESSDGRIWKHRGLFQTSFGNETAFVFQQDGSALAIARSGGGRNAQICRAEPPYINWERSDLDRYIGGPLLARWGDRYVVGGRQTNGDAPRMSLYWLHGDQLEEFATLPSGGDCSYPGLVEQDDGSVLVSYYSSHKRAADGSPITAIYLAHLTRD